MYEHERSLVQQMKDKRFALLGVNSDKRDVAKDATKRENLTWRSWSDGSTSGPISRQYNVHSWPTIYVLDQRGVIRFKNVRGDAMEKAVEVLLAEMDGADPKSTGDIPVIGGSSEVRTWTDSTGKYTLEAEFLVVKDGKAHLKPKTGDTIEVPLSKLSAEDQKFIRETLKKRKNKN